MTCRISRVFSAISHQQGAPAARGELTLDPAFAREFLKWQAGSRALKPLSDTDLLLECCQSLQLDLVCIQSGETFDNESNLSMKLNRIGSISRGGFFVFWVVNGAFQSMMARRAMMALLMDIAHFPRDVFRELRQLSDQVAAIMAHGVAAGAHGIIIADDIAYKQSTYMSPNFVQRYLLPIWQKHVSTARELGVPVFFHSDGNLNAVLPTIVAAGYDGLQCIEPAAGMDLPAIKRKYGKDLCLMGNVDPALLSHENRQSDTPSIDGRLAHAVNALIDSLGTDGGLIFGTCSGLHHGMSPERVDFMYRLVSDRELVSHLH
jgi:uroporphyrinogen decarboxylase